MPKRCLKAHQPGKDPPNLKAMKKKQEKKQKENKRKKMKEKNMKIKRRRTHVIIRSNNKKKEQETKRIAGKNTKPAALVK